MIAQEAALHDLPLGRDLAARDLGRCLGPVDRGDAGRGGGVFAVPLRERCADPVATRSGRGEENGRERLAPGAAQHHVLEIRGAGADDLAAQRAGAHLDPACELEILREPAVEAQAAGLAVEKARIAGAVEAEGIERQRRLARLGQIGGAEHRAAEADLGPVLDRAERDLVARQRPAEQPGPVDAAGAEAHGRAGFRGAIAREERDRRRAAAGEGGKPVPERGLDRRPRKEDVAQPCERPGLALGGGLERGEQQLHPERHTDVERRAHRLHQIERGTDRVLRRRPVEMQRAAVPDHLEQVVEPAEDMVPGHPVDQHRPLGKEGPERDGGGLAGRDLAAGDGDALRCAGAAGGKEDRGPVPGLRRMIGARRGRWHRVGQGKAAGGMARGGDDQIGLRDRKKAHCLLPARIAERKGRQRDMDEAAAQAGEPQPQRRDAGGQQRRHPRAGAQAMRRHEPVAQLPRLGQRRTIGDAVAPPGPGRGHQHPLRIDGREPVKNVGPIVGQRDRRAQHERPVLALRLDQPGAHFPALRSRACSALS
ncbi:hypothetical protein SDC9_26423 [bioreactor metagenome]|uniref:Uncharacterized protein n=1 Tax=bioreactor metagenome TaxID=1076179 RepID=A0A644UP27_9ZZZZ